MDWRRAYNDLYEEHQRVRRSLGEAEAIIDSSIQMLEAKANCENVHELTQEVVALRDALKIVTNLHEREYRDGAPWCRECLYEWPCRTLYVISQIGNVFGW